MGCPAAVSYGLPGLWAAPWRSRWADRVAEGRPGYGPALGSVPESGRVLPFEALERLDAEAARLGRGVGAWRLRLGEALLAMQRSSGYLPLGFSRFGDYGAERTGQSARWCQQSATVAKRVAGLLVLRRAMLTGDVSWSMGELLAGHASAEDEAALVERARGCTVRQMKGWLAERKARAEPDAAGRTDVCAGPDAAVAVGEEDDEEPRTTLTLSLPLEDAWLLERGFALCARLGTPRREDALEALLAEGMDQLMCDGRVPVAWLAEETARDEARLRDQRAANAVRAAWREEAEEMVEEAGPVGSPVPAEGGVPAGPLPLDAPSLDRVVHELAGRLGSRDRELARRAIVLHEANHDRRLGYASLQQYVRERVGVSMARWKAAVALGRRLRALPVVDQALADGVIGVEAARAIARVASDATQHAWVARARERTFKHLREEVAYTAQQGRLHGRDGLPPPGEDVVRALQGFERTIRSADGRMSARDAFEETAAKHPEVDAWLGDEARGTRRRGGLVQVRLRVSVELALYYRQVERAYRLAAGWRGSFVQFLVETLARSWAPVLAEQEGVAYAHVYARDLGRCMSPVCTRTDLTPHHIVFRSRGGGDEDENVGSVCVDCHLTGVHAGRIQVTGTANAPRWVLGRTPIALVEGRRVMWC